MQKNWDQVACWISWKSISSSLEIQHQCYIQQVQGGHYLILVGGLCRGAVSDCSHQGNCGEQFLHIMPIPGRRKVLLILSALTQYPHWTRRRHAIPVGLRHWSPWYSYAQFTSFLALTRSLSSSSDSHNRKWKIALYTKHWLLAAQFLTKSLPILKIVVYHLEEVTAREVERLVHATTAIKK